MSTTSPQKRRASALRSNMRQTRSMARISDMTDFSELPSSSRLANRHQPAPSTSSHPRNTSPHKARASQAAELDSFDPDSPDVSMAACMESPKKGRFDDFEFELESSNPELPTRRRRIAPPPQRERTTSPSADVGLPRSKTSANLARSSGAEKNPLLTSRKENSPTGPSEDVRPGASPVKPVAALPRSSRLHGPAPTARSSSQVTTGSDTKVSIPNRLGSAKPTDSAASESATVGSNRDSSHRLLFGSSDIKSEVKRNPFLDDSNGLAALGEPRHSPVKRFQAKTEFIISSQDRPDRKPINLLELKPSPGKAQRGIFRHNSAHDDDDDEEDEDDDWDASGSNTVDEIRLVKGPAPKREQATTNPSSSSASSGSAASSTAERRLPRSTTTLDVKHTLSTETSDALASLEASLARLKAKTRSPTTLSSSASSKKETDSSADTALKRELGTSRPTCMTSSRTQIFRTKPTVTSSESSFSIRSNTADQSSGGDSGVFKRPSGRVSALAKVRGSSAGDASTSMLASSKSMMSFGAPRLPGFGERGSSRQMGGSRTSSLEVASRASSVSREEEEAAQEEEEARVAEAKRQAELKAAKRRSMSVLSSGMPPPPPVRGERAGEGRVSSARSTSSSSSSRPSSSAATAATESAREPTEAELAEARKAAKAARRRSLYTYVPPKREDSEADRSTGNLSTGLVVTNSVPAAVDGDAKKAVRFLRGLTVLVDVRDQDGEDASACWIDMLKNAGAKVMVRFGERKLTHIVYKSGKPSTLHSYRALEDKPHVVGIGWVVACMEQGKRADESPFLVEVAKQAIFATRRRSLMAPKQVPPSAKIGELLKDKLKDVEAARRKLLVHAPAVPSPLRRKVSSTSLLAVQLARASIWSSPTRPDRASGGVEAEDDKTAADDEDGEGDALLESYRQRVGSVLAQRSAAVA